MSFDDMVTVKVGPKKKVFTAPRNVLCRSPFFKAALSGNWAEGKKALTLPEDRCDTFAIYLQWAVSGQVVISDEESTLDNQWTHFTGLVELYILADKLGEIALQNKVIDEFRAMVKSLNIIPHHGIVDRLFAATPENCMLQKLILDRYTYTFKPEGFAADVVRELPEVFTKVLTAMGSQRLNGGLQQGLPKDREARCYYHVHNEDTPACE